MCASKKMAEKACDAAPEVVQVFKCIMWKHEKPTKKLWVVWRTGCNVSIGCGHVEYI
jgi:hypothetical protein